MKKRHLVFNSKFETRDDDGEKHIEGYFAVFDSVYDIGPGMSESIAPGAFDETLSGDIRALINHDTTLVLGRTGAGTLTLKVDSHGLWGDILVNPNDQDAMNAWARVDRRDVSQCSIGFDILSEREVVNGSSVHWTIEKIKLYEVSVCTFPAYKETEIKARSHDFETLMERKKEIEAEQLREWKESIKKRLKGESDGTESADAE